MHSFTNQKLGRRMRELRVAAGVSQSELGRRLEISYQQVQKYEVGKDKISIERLYQISDILNASVGDFLQEPELAPVRRSDLSLMSAIQDLPEKQRAAFLNLAVTIAEQAHA